MNLKEAYAILEIPETSTPDEAKKKFRELVKKYHPDRNKDEEAPEKIKKINEAYQVVSTGKSTDREVPRPRGNPFNPFGQQVIRMAEPINLFLTLSFKDSVLGCKRDIKFQRSTKCSACNGDGEIHLNNGCDKCGGRGQVVDRQGHNVFIQTCPKCFGRTPSQDCTNCKSTGTLEAETSINVTIPGGVLSGNTLRLGNMGNYMGNFGPIEQYTDAHLHITVLPEQGLSLEGTNVVSNIQISLLEALKGCKKTVKTVSGDKQIDIRPKSRNKEEVIIPHLGVNAKGNQRVILDVVYPDNVEQIVSLLSE